jgi:hypothetical protein
MRLKGGAVEKIYIGVDFHARQQTICYLKTETGELVITALEHQDREQVRAFYQQFPSPVVVGGSQWLQPWFEALLEQLGCEVWLGHATEIRRRARWRQKNDRRDAELIWGLMVHDEFPRLHRPAVASREVLRMLRYRQKLIKLRTMANKQSAGDRTASRLSQRQTAIQPCRTGGVQKRHHVSGAAMAARALVRTAATVGCPSVGNHGLVQGP